MSRPPIDTSLFMTKYHHPRNIAAAKSDPRTGRLTIATSYSRSKGLYRQKQVDNEIERCIQNGKNPSSSKITIATHKNIVSVYHYHHHCLDFQMDGKKGRVVWFWDTWETATDERVMKGAIAALDSSWSEKSSGNPVDKVVSTQHTAQAGPRNARVGEKRHRAAVAAEARRVNAQKGNKKQCKSGSEKVIDLTDRI